MPDKPPVIEERVPIPAPGRTLEGVLAYPDGAAFGSAVIAGPHPFLGGDMSNNVVTALAGQLAVSGLAVLTFNYGGVGASEGGPADWAAVTSAFWKDGTFPEEGEWVADTASALAAMRKWRRDRPVLLGYSFGCWTAVRNLKNVDARAVVLVSPNPARHDFDGLNLNTAPLLVIHSDNDFTCDVTDMTAWFQSVRDPKCREQIPAGEHFFKGREATVCDTVLSFLRREDMIGTTRHAYDHV
jgi:alpha/beta superfamily hydrolase